ncbi:hypothetical protein GF318_01740 [Candidatus Micrarchaeota archaeon]|nr:hypothetical protein [Candidatus Micrarchaeota archaeon]
MYAQQSVLVGNDGQQVDLALRPNENTEVPALAALMAVPALSRLCLNSGFSSKSTQPVQKAAEFELGADAKHVLEALDSFDRRASQKELKQLLKFSDAKLSLILTELNSLDI